MNKFLIVSDAELLIKWALLRLHEIDLPHFLPHIARFMTSKSCPRSFGSELMELIRATQDILLEETPAAMRMTYPTTGVLPLPLKAAEVFEI